MAERKFARPLIRCAMLAAMAVLLTGQDGCLTSHWLDNLLGLALTEPPAFVLETSAVFDLFQDDGGKGSDTTHSTQRGRTQKLEVPGKRKRRKLENYYFAIQADEGATGQGFIRIPRRLRSPFCWEATIGVFDPELEAGLTGGFACTELDVARSDPLRWYALCVEYVNGGITVWIASHRNQNHGQRFFANTRLANLQIKHAGSELTFNAKAPSETGYTEIGRVAIPPTDLPLLPSLGASRIRDGAEFGFDDYRIVENGPHPGPLTPDVRYVETLFGAMEKQLDAMHRLDGVAPDTAGALTLLEAAQTDLDAARAAYDDMLASAAKRRVKPNGTWKNAAKYLKKSTKKLRSTTRKLAKGKPARKITKALRDLFLQEGRALTGWK